MSKFVKIFSDLITQILTSVNVNRKYITVIRFNSFNALTSYSTLNSRCVERSNFIKISIRFVAFYNHCLILANILLRAR